MTTKSLYRGFLTLALSCASIALVSCAGDNSTSPLEVDTRNTIGGANLPYSWAPMTSPTAHTLWGVWGSAGEVIAVGNSGTAAHLVAEPWQTKDSGTFNDLCDVWSDGNARAFAVGLGGTILRYGAEDVSPLAVFAAAGTWSPMNSGTSVNLADVFGFEDGTAIAVGEGGTILRFDGSAWAPMTSITSVNLFGVWGSAPDDLFAVGVGGTIVHFDGTAWSFMTTITSENLNAVYGNSATDVWAVGDNGTIMVFDGTAWGMSACSTPANLGDVWTVPGELWAVGSNGTIFYQGGAPLTCAVVESGTTANLLGIWGRSACEIYAVGASGTILRYGPTVDESIQTFVCHDHPEGVVAPPTYGLRIDDLLGEGQYTFSFDYSDGVEDALVTLTYDEDNATIRIAGRAYGGLLDGDDWSASARGWVDIDFTYGGTVAVYDNCARAAGDDLYVTGASSLNTGTFTLDGWGGNTSFSFMDRADGNGCSFVFDNDWDSKGVEEIANDPNIWSAAGWLQPGTAGDRDWVFTATRYTPPTECGSGN